MFEFGPDVPEVDAQQVLSDIEEKRKMVLIDVRTSPEYSRGYIKGSINVPIAELPVGIKSEVKDKDATIIVYCLSGSRSAQAADILLKMGYKNVFSMTSGLLAWRAKGYSLKMPD